MHSTALPKKTHNNQYGGYLLAIAGISLLLFALTSGTFAVPFTSSEQISHTSSESSAAGSGGLAAGHVVNVTASRAGGAVFDAAEGAGNTDTTQAGFSGIGGAKSGSQEHEPAWQEPDAEDGSDGTGGGGVAPSGTYMVEAEPDTPYIFSARGISSDFNGTYEPLVTAMEVDGNCMEIVEHNLSFSGCYDWVEKEITFTTSSNVSEFYVSMNTWECGGTFRVEDVVLEVYEAPLPGISDLGYTAGRTWINWTWVNPDDVRFAYVTVQLNGTYVGVTPGSFYNATGLDSGGCYEIGVRTVDVSGNASETEVNRTAETGGDGEELSVRASDGLEFSLAESGAVSGVSIDDLEMSMLSVPGGFSFRELSSTISENLIANPGFEKVSGDVPLNWTLVSGAGTVVYDASEGYDSLGSIKVDVPGTVDVKSGYPKSNLIDAKPGTEYTFSAWGKSSGVNGKYAPAVRVVELDRDGGWITQHNLIFDRDSDWQEKKTSFTTSSDVSKLHVYANIWESYGTFWVDDLTLRTCGTGNIPLENTVEKNYDGSITQYVTSSDIAFRFDYIPRDRYIEVHGDIQDLRGVDRAIQVQYVLPVDATGWQWGDYIRKSREIESRVRYENVYRIGEERTQNAYPFTFVGEDKQGLSLAVPMDVPRIYRIGYDTDVGGYSIEYDFGLANCTDKIGAGHANFTFIVYKVDEPEWGFRAVAKKYYELYPEFFVKRNEWEGLWICGHDPSDIPDASDFGFAFDDAHYYLSSRRIYDHHHEIYPMQYTEPFGWWRDFGDNSTEPSYDEKIAALMDDYNNDTGTWREVVTTKFAAEAALNTAPYDKNGNQYLDYPYFWHNWGYWAQNYPENPDPDIPSPNRYDISYAKYLRSNESGVYAYNWTFSSNCSIDTIAHSGNYSGKIEILGTSDVKSGSIASDHISAAPLTTYNFSAWGKTLNCGGSNRPCVRAAEYDSSKTWITQKNLEFGFGTTNWTQETITFTTTTDTVYIRVYANFWNGYGTFWFDDVELYESGSDDNLVKNHGFESIYDASDYPCSGFRIDSLTTTNGWAKIENYRREHWEYTDHPLVFSYHTKQPVLLGTLSQYDCLSPMHENMTDMDKRVDANIWPYAYSFYGHLVDVLGSEVWGLQMDDDDASLRRTMSYQKTNRNLLQWTRHGTNTITYEEMENYMNDQMFYGMFPSIGIAAAEETYRDSRYWNNVALYERDRDLFKKYIPIIKDISAAGWEPIPYATCDNPDIRFERYGDLSECLYYTVASRSSTVDSDALSVDLSKLGFDGTAVEVEELVTKITSTQNAEDGKVLIAIPELHPHDTLVYKISP